MNSALETIKPMNRSIGPNLDFQELVIIVSTNFTPFHVSYLRLSLPGNTCDQLTASCLFFTEGCHKDELKTKKTPMDGDNFILQRLNCSFGAK
jgi:hypothetical protein